MSEDDFYRLTIELNAGHQQLLMITGSRATVIEAGLRVMLDCAPAWNQYAGFHPLFSVDCFRIKA